MRLRHGPAGSTDGLHARPPIRGARAGGRGARWLLLGITLAGALLVASACEVGVGVDIDVAENGSGTVAVGVSLDRAAADALGDLASQLDLQDLALAGWDVTGPAREADNLLWVRATKRFGSAEELPAVLAEIAGPDAFGGFELRRRSAFAEQTWEVAGQIDPAAALREVSDTLAFNAGLRERIVAAGGEFGNGVPLEGLTVRLNIDLPGELTGGTGDFTWTGLTEDSSASAVAVRMTAHEENTTAKTLRLVGLAAAALFVLALLLNVLGWWYIRRHRKRRTSALMAKADSEQIPLVANGTAESVAAGTAAPPAADDEWDLGDTYDIGDDIEWLTPPGDTDATEAVGEDVDWDEFEDADFEDLSGNLDDLAPADTEAGDWTASLEESPDIQPELGFVATPPEETDEADEPEEVGAWGTRRAEARPDEPEPGEPDEPDEPDEPEPDEPDEAGGTRGARGTRRARENPTNLGNPRSPRNPTSPTKRRRNPKSPSPSPRTEEPERTREPGEPEEPGEPDDAAETEPAATAPAPAPTPDALRLVVIGGWGVLFQPADPVGELLVPFVRQAGATASPAEIRESYRLATLGRLTPEQLWESCGLTGTPTWTHGPYTGRMSVSAGAADFVRALLRRRIAVACVTNDVSDWSWRLRAWTGFEAISPWVVSSDIGICKPDPGVFEMLRRVSEVPFANCLVIDNDPRALDAARSLGMSTCLFGTPATGPSDAESTHAAVGDFTDLLRRT